MNITDKVRRAFRSKLWRIGHTLSKIGGTKRQKLIGQWKETTWSFSIDIDEFSRHVQSRKRHLEKQLESETTKRQKLERELASLRTDLSHLRKSSEKQAKIIVSEDSLT